MKERFNVITGISDYKLGITSPVISVVLGAKIIEKHFIIYWSIGGPDASFSLNEKEFTEMVKAVREAELAIGEIDYTLTSKQVKGREFSRSLYVSQDAEHGDTITENNIKLVRPGFGLHLKFYEEVIGKKFSQKVHKGQRLTIDLIE